VVLLFRVYYKTFRSSLHLTKEFNYKNLYMAGFINIPFTF